MSPSEHKHPNHDAVDGEHIRHDSAPYWKRAHTDWRFWVGLVLMFAAITIYFMSDDLSLFHRGRQLPAPPPSAVTR
jgi:hypothetical protein